jgi:L-ascorbate metabolism protein UlaG (beta-lactamase superfamily)
MVDCCKNFCYNIKDKFKEKVMKDILITGASGGMGKAVVDLLKNEYRIFALDKKIGESEDNVVYIECDLTNEESVTLITDPFQGVGYELPFGVQADIVTVSHDHFDHNNVSAVGGSPEWIQGEGIGECKGISFKGVKTWHDLDSGKLRGKNTVYIIETDGIRLCHLGDIGELCTDELCKKIGKVDVLFVPIGGTFTIDAQEAKKYADKLAPSIIIPMHYRPHDGKLDIDGADVFLLQYAEEEIFRVKGEVFLTKQEIEQANKKIIFMERVD